MAAIESGIVANNLTREKQIDVIHHLAEGNSIRATSRLTRVHRNTVMNLLVEFGTGSGHFMDLAFSNIRIEHVEIDEIWTFVQKKQARLTEQEKDEDPTIGEISLFTALDKDTKLGPAFVVGKATKDHAVELAEARADRIVWRPGARGDVQVSTDGFPGYPDAIDGAFGQAASHGVLIKNYENPEVGRYAPPKLVDSDRRYIHN